MVNQKAEEIGFKRRAMRAELLDAETEQALARAWRDDRDEAALHRLINAYMRLAISMAGKFRRYNLPMNDLIQEAGLGLMQAADRFDPDRGVRFSTYAVWWIRAGLQDFVMRNWSLVRTGSTSSQKTLFFNLRRVQARLERDAASSGEMLDRQVLRERIAQETGVRLSDVEMMEGRLGGADFSLNAPQTGEDGDRSWIDALEDPAQPGQAQVDLDRDRETLRDWLVDAMSDLSERERFILRERRLNEDPRTLESLGQELGLSKERIRQLEVAGFAKMRKALEAHGAEVRNLLA
ncbi:MAG: RNA polymerase factor sigma-32 [Pelagimonas sp.]|jgi:RNA polymerase sigma-32 factor|nr:RNA polymerase factor sigma-32 [Pelagimonas sp.]